MATQVLAGSIGIYRPINRTTIGNAEFTVTHDTCLESEKLPVRFTDGVIGTWIRFNEVSGWVSKLTRDY
jgi:hypothetical protein